MPPISSSVYSTTQSNARSTSMFTIPFARCKNGAKRTSGRAYRFANALLSQMVSQWPANERRKVTWRVGSFICEHCTSQWYYIMITACWVRVVHLGASRPFSGPLCAGCCLHCSSCAPFASALQSKLQRDHMYKGKGVNICIDHIQALVHTYIL